MSIKKNKKKIAELRGSAQDVFPPELHDGHPLSNDWTGTMMAFELLERFIDDRHKVLRCYDGFNKSYPQWLKESGRVREIKTKVMKLLWEDVHKKAEQKTSTQHLPGMEAFYERQRTCEHEWQRGQGGTFCKHCGVVD